jgi:hypothetical protein
VLQIDTVARGKVIGAGSRIDDGIELTGLELRHLQGALGRGQTEVHSGFAFPYPAALLNSGAGADPFVAGIHQRREFLVGHYPVGHREAGAENARMRHQLS